MKHKKTVETPPKRSFKITLVIFIGNVIGLCLISLFGLGVKVNYLDDILFFVIFISIINSILWPILTRIFMPFLVLTFGFGVLLLNGALLQFFAPLFDIEINGFAIILA